VWIGATVLKHQHLLFGGARSRIEPRGRGLTQLAMGVSFGSAAATLMFLASLAVGLIRITYAQPSVETLTASLTTALPVAIASAVLTCLLPITIASRVVSRPWIVAVLATAVAIAAHLALPGTTPLTAAGAGALALGMALAFANTGRLWMPIGLAFGWLVTEGPIFGFPTNGFPIGHPWFSQQVMQYTTLGGGVIGPAASVLATGAKLVAAGAVAWYTNPKRKQA
jgi:hypothetical protein